MWVTFGKGILCSSDAGDVPCTGHTESDWNRPALALPTAWAEECRMLSGLLRNPFVGLLERLLFGGPQLRRSTTDEEAGEKIQPNLC